MQRKPKPTVTKSEPAQGPYRLVRYFQSPEDVAEIIKAGLTPTRALTNEGQAIIVAGHGDDTQRIALVDCRTKYKRGEGYRAECPQRDATAELLAASWEMREALREIADAIDVQPHVRLRARAALDKAGM